MKLLLALLAFAAAPAHAEPVGNPLELKCNKLPAAARAQKRIIKDLRSRVAQENPANEAFSFRFTAAWGRSTNQLTSLVYFEKLTGGDQGSRQAYAAEYAVDNATCEPTFLDSKLLVAGNDPVVTRLQGFEDKERCNFAEGQEKVIKAVVQYAKWISGVTIPGAEIDNFAFSGVKRSPGAADAVAIYEYGRSGQLSNGIIASVKVDPATCDATVESSTSFRNTYVIY